MTPNLDAMSRVLVTEKLAERGLEALRSAGLQVDVRLGLDPDQLLDAVRGAEALIVRSATRVTADVLEAGDELVVVGRAGIGVDNIDVDTATRRGVMVVNAELDRARQRRAHAGVAPRDGAQHPAGRPRPPRRWLEPVTLGGRRAPTTRRSGSWVSVASACSWRNARAFGMRIIGRELFMSDERARQLGVELTPTLEELVAQATSSCSRCPSSPRTWA